MVLVAAATAGVLSVGGVTAAAASPRPVSATSMDVSSSRQTAANKALVVHVFDQLFNQGNLAVIDRFFRPDYIQHHPNVPDGREALRQYVTSLRAAHPRLHVTVERALAEGDLVLLHSHSVSDPGTKGDAIVDIFRVHDGRIAEHWDVIQPVADTSVSGNDMFSTLSAPQRRWPDPSVSTAASKRVVTAMFEEVTAGRDVTAFDRYAVDPFYQHNPQSPNGIAAAKAFFASQLENPGFSVSVQQVIGEGDYVAVHALYKFASDDPGTPVLDLYRVRDGKVVEHWDVIQSAAPTA
ncbi:nuclear transport factor 2 family protein [Streptomyces sp. NPDC007162]|uniref:nuclear transport factor 2 family protein n=1 Tax=Streptomyces sp. NPDC007162 TaxID=3156917 RepID=UPI0033D31C41